MINERIENRLFHYLTHKILEAPGARLHAIGGIENHIHIAVSLQPNILVSEWIGKFKRFEFALHQSRSSSEGTRVATRLRHSFVWNEGLKVGYRIHK